MKTPCEFKVMRVRECVSSDLLIETPAQAVEYWQKNIPQSSWFDPNKEALVALVLNTRRRIIGHNLVTLGLLDACMAHPRECFRPVIVASGSAVILVHNHPSGDPNPSQADIQTTRELIRASRLLKIDLLDHIIVGTTWLSLRELGHFNV